MSKKGWISVHRKILDNPVFQDPYLFKLWMYCLLKASHSEHKQLVGKEIVKLSAGQFIWGREEASRVLNEGTKKSERKSSSSWERYLKTLENLEMLNRKTNNKYTVVSIVNWHVYQNNKNDFEQHIEQQMNSKRTASEQQVNTNNNVNNANNINKEEEEGANPFLLFEENICRLNNLNQQSLIMWCDDLGDDLVVAAIKLASKHGAYSFSYLENILKEWSNQNIKTIDEARSYVSQKERKKTYKNNGNLINLNGGDEDETRNYDESVGDHGVKLYK